MKSIELYKVTIVCDDCDFEVEAEPRKWLNKSCPKCGDENLITEKDILVHESMLKATELMNEALGEIPSDSFIETVDVKITDGNIVEINHEK